VVQLAAAGWSRAAAATGAGALGLAALGGWYALTAPGRVAGEGPGP
jgi:hypothetical protein